VVSSATPIFTFFTPPQYSIPKIEATVEKYAWLYVK
jgi:hypothetical protein